MTTMTEPPQSFRPSMLVNDTRYRGYTFQFIALILLALGLAWLFSNAAANLEAQGLDISFGFLEESAGYDINQTPIEYTNRSSHLRAAFVGVLNTLIVAALGCVTATILGVTAGVLRLSPNWLISKLMAVYVEAFRNVPVLIWILIIFFVTTAAFPAPAAFRGQGSEASTLLGIAFTNRGLYLPSVVAGQGAMVLLAVFAASVAGVFVWRRFARNRLYERGQELPVLWPSLAILILPSLLVWAAFSVAVGGRPNALLVPASPDVRAEGIALPDYLAAQGSATLCAVDGASSTAVAKRGILAAGIPLRTRDVAGAQEALAAFESGGCDLLVVPEGERAAITSQLTAQTAMLSTTVRDGRPFELELPYLAGFNFADGLNVRGSLIALWLALAVYTGAFIAENVRAGIQAVARGQTEAASSLGLRPNRIMSLVVLPQALRIIIPPLISQYLNLTKNSSLAIAVGYMDVTGTLGGITLNQTGRAIECVLLLMLFYLVISLSISSVMNVYNNAVSLKER